MVTTSRKSKVRYNLATLFKKHGVTKERERETREVWKEGKKGQGNAATSYLSLIAGASESTCSKFGQGYTV